MRDRTIQESRRRRNLCWNWFWRDLQHDEVARSCDEVNRLNGKPEKEIPCGSLDIWFGFESNHQRNGQERLWGASSFAAPGALIMPIASFAVPFADILYRRSATPSAAPFVLNRRRAACFNLFHADASATRRPTLG